MAIGKQQIQYLAQSAVKGYFEGNGSIQDQILKIAEEHKLSSHEIARVVEDANRTAHISIFAKNGPKDAFEFPLAKTADILRAMNLEIPEVEPVVAQGLPKTSSSPWTDLEKEDWNPRQHTKQQFLDGLLGEIRLAESETLEKIADVEREISKVASQCIEDMRQEFVGGELDPECYYAWIRDDRPHDLVLAESLIQEATSQSHMEKGASMSSAFLVNGAPLIPSRERRKAITLTLDTIRSRAAEATALHDGLVIIQDQAKRVEKSIATNLRQVHAL